MSILTEGKPTQCVYCLGKQIENLRRADSQVQYSSYDDEPRGGRVFAIFCVGSGGSLPHHKCKPNGFTSSSIMASSGIAQTTIRFSFALSKLWCVPEGLGLFSGTFYSLRIDLRSICFSYRTFTLDRLPLFLFNSLRIDK
jgi:hypothetical protein